MAYPDSSYAHYTFEVDNTNVDSNQVDFPVVMDLAKLPSGVKNWITARIDADGHGLRITDNSFTPLSYERKNFVQSPLSGQVYFKAPLVTSASQSAFKLFAEDESDGEDAINAWKSSYKAVWHLESAGDATQADSTANGNTATPTNLESGDSVAGEIGQALDLDGSNEYLSVPNHTSINASQLTIECIVEFDTLTGGRTLIEKGKGAGVSYALALNIINSGYLEFISYNGAWVSVKWATSNLSTGTRYRIAGTYDGTNMRLYVDGDLKDTAALASIDYTTPLQLTIGRFYAGGAGGHYLDGKIDECSVQSNDRTAAWLKFAYYNGSESDNELENWSLVSTGNGSPHYYYQQQRIVA